MYTYTNINMIMYVYIYIFIYIYMYYISISHIYIYIYILYIYISIIVIVCVSWSWPKKEKNAPARASRRCPYNGHPPPAHPSGGTPVKLEMDSIADDLADASMDSNAKSTNLGESMQGIGFFLRL